MDYKKLLGKRIQELRKRKGLKQEQLAEICNVEPASVSNIENGRNYPSFQTLEKIIRALGISFTEVFKFSHKQSCQDLLNEINNMLKEHPQRIEDVYKVIKALIE